MNKFDLIYITNSIPKAKAAEVAGVDRIMVDLEILGKRQRQMGRDTLISGHRLEDVSKLRLKITNLELLVRVNPIHEGSANEINKVISSGADSVMLPMFRTANEVRDFVDLVDGRARTIPLIETAEAAIRIEEILEVDGCDEFYVGLNDLHLSLGLNFMFETLSCGFIDWLVNKIGKTGVPFGFGGIAPIGQGVIDSSLILSEHVRLGSTSVILSRDFHAVGNDTKVKNRSPIDLVHEISLVRGKLLELFQASQEDYEQTRKHIKSLVRNYVAKLN